MMNAVGTPLRHARLAFANSSLQHTGHVIPSDTHICGLSVGQANWQERKPTGCWGPVQSLEASSSNQYWLSGNVTASLWFWFETVAK